MYEEVVRALQVIDPHATLADLRDACRDLFLRSDLYAHSTRLPYDASEVEAVTDAIYKQMLFSSSEELRSDPEVNFRAERRIRGVSIGFCEFQRTESEDLLYQNLSDGFVKLEVEDLKRALRVFLAGILYRYEYCANSDLAVFRASTILEYMDAVCILLSKEHREHELPEVVLATLQAMKSLEWTTQFAAQARDDARRHRE